MSTLLFASLIVFVYMSVFFLIAVARKDNSLADIAWGGGFILVAMMTFFHAPGGAEARQVLVTGLVVIWGVRLAVHIYFRNRGKAEDFRYAKWRRDWGKYFLLRSYLQVFMLQGALLVVIVWSVIFINMHPVRGLSVLDALGLLVWTTGFFFEAVGDYQLLRFTRDPANKGCVMKTGLWRYTRHPNYFGEATMWWGIFLMALPLEGGYAALISPLTITFLLLKVSGIPMLEKKLMETQEGYAEYARRTSAFVPWFPREPE
ncbi:MAG: DUF1295 domain-containing protein [Synergistales bacterium]|nr:DUF1295 domain-containing protein [Synergistales bacterium]